MELKNGATIIRLSVEVSQSSSGDTIYEGIVMAHHPDKGAEGSFVTWRVHSMDGGETFDAFWGHYFPEFGDAFRDYGARLEDL